MLNSKIMKKKVVPEDNGKQDPEEISKDPEQIHNKYQKQTACSYGYKLVSVDDKFSNTFKTT